MASVCVECAFLHSIHWKCSHHTTCYTREDSYTCERTLPLDDTGQAEEGALTLLDVQI